MTFRSYSILVASTVFSLHTASLACEAHAAHATATPISLPSAQVVSHAGIKAHEMRSNAIRGVATPSQGAKEFEVWLTSIAPGSSTPPHHKHTSEEIFVFTEGEGVAVVGNTETPFKSPCTVIMPANVPHHIKNTGMIATHATVIVGVGSKIYDKDGKQMDLPWRK